MTTTTETLTHTDWANKGFGSSGTKTSDQPAVKATDCETEQQTRTNTVRQSTWKQCIITTTTKPKPAPQHKEEANHKGTMINTEIWRQDLGHIGLQKLKATSKCTKGMDNIGNMHPLFQC